MTHFRHHRELDNLKMKLVKMMKYMAKLKTSTKMIKLGTMKTNKTYLVVVAMVIEFKLRLKMKYMKVKLRIWCKHWKTAVN